MLKDREQAKPNNNYWMGVLINYYRNNFNSDSPDNYENILKQVTTADVKKFAKNFFSKPDQVEIVFKPLKSLK